MTKSDYICFCKKCNNDFISNDAKTNCSGCGVATSVCTKLYNLKLFSYLQDDSFMNALLKDEKQINKVNRLHRDITFISLELEKRILSRKFLEGTHLLRLLSESTRVLIKLLLDSESVRNKLQLSSGVVSNITEVNVYVNQTKKIKLKAFLSETIDKSNLLSSKYPLLEKDKRDEIISNLLNKWMHYSVDWDKLENNRNKDDVSTLHEFSNKMRFSYPDLDEYEILCEFFYDLHKFIIVEIYGHKGELPEYNKEVYMDIKDFGQKLNSNKYISKLLNKCPMCGNKDGFNNKPDKNKMANRYRLYLHCKNEGCNAKVDKTMLVKRDLYTFSKEEGVGPKDERFTCKKDSCNGKLQVRINLIGDETYGDETFQYCIECGDKQKFNGVKN